MSVKRLATLVTTLLLLALPAGAATYKIDGVHSSALFKIKHFNTANFYGMFDSVSGTITYDEANPSAAVIEVEIDAESINSRNERRDGHIISPDFLDAKQFPKIRFQSKSVREVGGKLEITGNLDLHGVKQEITATAVKTGEGKGRRGEELIGFEAQFTVDRTTHDMNYMVGPLDKEIHFILSVEAAKQ